MTFALACTLLTPLAFSQTSATQQAVPVPTTPTPAEKAVPNAVEPPQKPVTVTPPPKAYPVPVPDGPSLFAYERGSEDPVGASDPLGSTYIPVDSYVYPLVLRLYSLGYADTAFINMRPYTRRSLLHILNATQDKIMADGNEEAEGILVSLQDYLSAESPGPGRERQFVYGIDSVYTRLMGISGQTLRDSYHLGETIANDYGRPYEPGFNNITGFSTVNELGRFSLYVRGEYEHAPAATGYSLALANQLSVADTIGPYAAPNAPQATIPQGSIAAQNPFRLQEATLSVRLFGHEVSGGKSDAWLGPGMGSAMAWSNNAEDIYSFRINRVDPLHIPLLSDLLGPFHYDFLVGSLKGHTAPNSPWIHSEQISFGPTPNVRFAFQRSVIWGGKDHEAINLHTFLRSFFSLSDTSYAQKFSNDDPGARFSDFNFSWRLPYLSHYVTLYADSISHDDVTPISAPRRAGYRPGVYISHFPGLQKLDFRIEGVNTDVSTTISIGGFAEYYEVIQKQGYTNKGVLLGDWIGREAKGGQTWLTYHLSPNEWVQVQYLHKKTDKDFVPGGTTQNQFTIAVVKRLRKDIEMNAWYQYEGWKAPTYIPGNALNKDNTISFQFTWFPQLRSSSDLPH